MKTAFNPADILLPKNRSRSDMGKWSVVACDQYTQEPEYWQKTDELVSDAKSTLRLILPEIFLEEDGVEARIDDIDANINKYLEEGVFSEYKGSMIYVRRTQSDGKLREGIIGAVDLEEYDYMPGSNSQIRATEATVTSRIPPRLKIRKDAALELPHIMILIDDPQKTVIEPLANKKLETLYDFELMQGGGSIEGRLMTDNEISQVDSALFELSKRSPMLFAMGDGNHSLATAKEHYESIKRQNPGIDMSCHPARYALCEIVNLHSSALEFEAIHRIVDGVDVNDLIESMTRTLELSEVPSDQALTVVIGGKRTELYIHKPLSKLAVGSLTQFLDEYTGRNGGRIDYIHGEEVIEELSARDDSVGFILKPMRKSELFGAVISDGALPRKTFSMGHAADKRYYLEARKIIL